MIPQSLVANIADRLKESDCLLVVGETGDIFRKCGMTGSIDAIPPGAAAAMLASLGSMSGAAYDAVVVFDFLSHLPDHDSVQNALVLIAQVLKEDGRLILIEFNGRYPQGFADSFDRITPVTHASVLRPCARAGLQAEEIVARFVPVGGDWLTRCCLRSELAQVIFSKRFLVVARKKEHVSESLSQQLIGNATHNHRHFVLLGLIILACLATHLYAINAPPCDEALSWRETQTLMIARNFYRHGMNLFLPAVDFHTTDAVVKEGIVGGTELNVVPYLTAILYFFFGIQDWIGRAVPLAFFLAGLFYFHRLVQRFYSPLCATIATALLAVSSFHFATAHTQMPEAFVFAASYATLYYYDKWLLSKRNQFFWFALTSTALMLLGKPQMAPMAAPMFFLTAYRFGWRLILNKRLYLYAALVGAPLAAYMMFSYSVLIPRTGLSFAAPELLNFALLGKASYYQTLATRIWNDVVGETVCVLAVLGLFVPLKTTRDWFVYAWVAGAVGLFFIIPGGNSANMYYQMIMAPPAVILAGRVIDFGFGTKWLRAPAIVAFAMAMLHSVHMLPPFYTPNLNTYACGKWIQENTDKNVLVLSSHASPAALYFADRQGWTCWKERYGKDIRFNRQLIEKVASLGASVVAIPDGLWLDNALNPQSKRYEEIRDYLYETYFCYRGDNFAVFFIHRGADLAVSRDGYVTFGEWGSRKYLRGTWGPNQKTAQQEPFVAMGTDKSAGFVFTAPGTTSSASIDLSSVLPDQLIAVKLDGTVMAEFAFPIAWKKAKITFDLPSVSQPIRKHLVTLEVAKQNESRMGLLLYSLNIK